MSAGSAFASGLRAGQAIWNSAANNAMQKKRLDMVKTQFKYEQQQRKQKIDNELAAQTAKDKFVDYLPEALASGEIDFSTPEGRQFYADLKSSVEPTILRDPATWKQYENFSKTFEVKEGYPVLLAEDRNRFLTVENYKTVSGENDPLYKRNKDGSFILNPDGKTQLDMPAMNEFIDNYKLEKEVDAIKKKQKALYGGNAFESMVTSGAPTAGMPKEMQAPVIIARQKRWADAVKSNDTDTIIGASNVHTKAPDGSERVTLGKYKFTLTRLGELQEQLKVVGDTGPIVGIFRSANPWDVKAQKLKAQITKIIPGLARGVFGEVGVLTNEDVALYSKTLGTLTSPEEINKLLTSAAIKMVSNSYEDKLRGMAESKIDVSGFLPGLKSLRSTASRLLGEEEAEEATQDRPVVEVEEYRGENQFSDEEKAEIRATGSDKVQILDKSTGKRHNIIGKPKAKADSTTPPAPRPNTMDVLEELWPESVNPPKEESKPAPSSDEIDKKLDKKLMIERRINVLQEQLDKLPSPPPSTRSRRSSYVPVYTNTKTDRDTEKKRKQLIESIKKNKENLSKL